MSVWFELFCACIIALTVGKGLKYLENHYGKGALIAGLLTTIAICVFILL